MVASLSAHNYVNHSIDNCPVLLLFNALALIHQSDPSSIWQCTCPLVNHTSSVCFGQSLHAQVVCICMHVCYIGCHYISDTMVRSCVAVLYWKHEILCDILTYLNQRRSRGAWVAGFCVAYNFFISISLITLKILQATRALESA